MTDDELKDIELDHEGVHHAQGWTVKVVLDDGTTAKAELTPEALPLDLKRCVDATPRLLAEVRRAQALREALGQLRTQLLDLEAECLPLTPRLRALLSSRAMLEAVLDKDHEASNG